MRSLASFGLFACLATLSTCALGRPPAHGASELRREAQRAKTWRYGWTAVNGGLTLGALAAVPLVSADDRPDFVVSGIGSAITTICTWIWPLRVEGAADELEVLGPAERARQAPRLRRESALDERERIRWPWHVANIGLAAAGGAVIAFGYRHYLSGALTAVAGGAIGEVQLFTQPTALIDSESADLQLVPHLALSPRLGAIPASWGLAISGIF
jgi:hypothetical protein